MTTSGVTRYLEAPNLEALLYAAFSGLVLRERRFTLTIDTGHLLEILVWGVFWSAEPRGGTRWLWYGSHNGHAELSHCGEFIENVRVPAMLTRLHADYRAFDDLFTWQLMEILGEQVASQRPVEYNADFPSGAQGILASLLSRERQHFFVRIIGPCSPSVPGLTAKTQGFMVDRTHGTPNSLSWVGQVEIANEWHHAFALVHTAGIARLFIY